MAISTMPYTIVNFFDDTKEWLWGNNTSGFIALPKCMITLIPGPLQLNLSIFGFVRKNDMLKVPFYQFVICYGSRMFQILVPCPQKDKHLLGEKLTFERFRFPFEGDWKYGKEKFELVDLSSNVLKRNDPVSIQLKYETIEKLD